MRSAADRAEARWSQLPRVLAGLLAPALFLLACTDQGSPATTPVTTSTPDAVTIRPETTTTTVDRVAEVEAILLELEERRLDALYREDLEALREVFSSDALYEQSLPIVGQLEFQEPPWEIRITVLEILADQEDCLAVRAEFDVTQALGPEAVAQQIVVLTQTTDGGWGIAYVGEGWICDGPNPLENDT